MASSSCWCERFQRCTFGILQGLNESWKRSVATRGRLSRWISISLVRMVFISSESYKAVVATVPIIVFSLFSEDQYGLRALRAGAAAYLSKERSPLELVEVVRSVLRGEKKGQRQPAAPVLSSRETEVLTLLGRGMNRQQIAHELGINEKTVSTYRARLLHKLNARTTVNLIRFAADEGLLGADQAPTC